MPEFSADVQASFCATVIDEWVHRGVRHAVVAPGSRSTPLALAVAARPELSLHVVHDERAAAFVALGLALGPDDGPALLVCTSGTAAANFLPAVVEAGLSDVPMIVLTADRPARLRNVGAAQTIDQVELYGRAVRWFHDVGVPAASDRGHWGSLASTAYCSATSRVGGARPGPVHLNLQFDEPLLGNPGPPEPPSSPLPDLDVGLVRPGPIGEASDSLGPDVVELLATTRGIVVVGGRSGVTRDDVETFATATGWPVLADPTSGCRTIDGAVTAGDALARVTRFTERHRPDVVVRIGRPPASKAVPTWLHASGAPLVQVGGPGVIDPDGTAIAGLPSTALEELTAVARTTRREPPSDSRAWRSRWVEASERAEAAIEGVLADALAGRAPLNEPAVARIVARHRTAGGEVVVASSMPVRDFEWFGGPTALAHANRGANGIDGVVSTALGRALTGVPVTALVGDVAFIHDGGALTALRHRRVHGRPVDLRIVVVDNDGGGIFSFLPQSTVLDRERFETLFGTPHGTDLVTLARAHGVDADDATHADSLRRRLDVPGPSITRVRSDRADNVEVHSAIHQAVMTALG